MKELKMTKTERIEEIRLVRSQYDSLDKGAKARLRRCRTLDDIHKAGEYWLITDGSPKYKGLVMLFPLAEQRDMDNFSFGKFLRNTLLCNRYTLNANGSLPESMNSLFRKIAASKDEEELLHRLTGIFRLIASDGTKVTVDWGHLGIDIRSVLREDSFTLNRWAEDFFTSTTNKSKGNQK